MVCSAFFYSRPKELPSPVYAQPLCIKNECSGEICVALQKNKNIDYLSKIGIVRILTPEKAIKKTKNYLCPCHVNKDSGHKAKANDSSLKANAKALIANIG